MQHCVYLNLSECFNIKSSPVKLFYLSTTFILITDQLISVRKLVTELAVIRIFISFCPLIHEFHSVIQKLIVLSKQEASTQFDCF